MDQYQVAGLPIELCTTTSTFAQSGAPTATPVLFRSMCYLPLFARGVGGVHNSEASPMKMLANLNNYVVEDASHHAILRADQLRTDAKAAVAIVKDMARNIACRGTVARREDAWVVQGAFSEEQLTHAVFETLQGVKSRLVACDPRPLGTYLRLMFEARTLLATTASKLSSDILSNTNHAQKTPSSILAAFTLHDFALFVGSFLSGQQVLHRAATFRSLAAVMSSRAFWLLSPPPRCIVDLLPKHMTTAIQTLGGVRPWQGAGTLRAPAATTMPVVSPQIPASYPVCSSCLTSFKDPDVLHAHLILCTLGDAMTTDSPIYKAHRLSKLEALDPMQQTAARIILQSNDNMYVGGQAGSGKSYMIKALMPDLFDRYGHNRVAIVALTGLASKAVDGQTFASWAGIMLDEKESAQQWIKRIEANPAALERWLQLALIVLEEVGMMAASTVQKLHEVAMYFRKVADAFGGARFVAFGDFLQIGPYNDLPAFMSSAWRYLRTVLRLCSSHRQKETEFIDILNRMRIGKVTPADLEQIEAWGAEVKRLEEEAARLGVPSPVPHLYGRRDEARDYNDSQLKLLKTTLHNIPALHVGDDEVPLAAETLLVLAEGARVITTATVMGPTGTRFPNGTLATVLLIQDDKIIVGAKESDDSLPQSITVTRALMSFGTREMLQFPLLLAYGITASKAQGLSLSHVVAYVGTMHWGDGMAYNAVSRGCTRAGTLVVDPRAIHFKTNAEALYYDQMLAYNMYKTYKWGPPVEHPGSGDADVSNLAVALAFTATFDSFCSS
jgi:hypothetical protein